MHRFIYRAVITALLAAGSLWPATPRAQLAGGPTVPQAAGDGAAGCAAAKSALATRAHRSPVSVASPNLDVTFYHLHIAPDFTTDTIAGVVRVAGTVVGASMSTMTLDLAPSMVVTAVARSDGTPLAFSHPGAALNIDLGGSVAVGGAVAVDVTYGGRPLVDGLGNFFFGTRNGQRLAWSLSEPYGARAWWPCKDHPSDKADSVRVSVTVPSLYRVGSQGVLERESSALGMTTYEWVSHYPVSSYLVSVAIGDYVTYQGTYDRPAALEARFGPLSLPLVHLVYNDTNSDLPAGWASVADMLAVFEDWFGPYPFPNEKYGHAEFTFGGGMEHQTMASLGGSDVGLVSHELSHQWFGDSISPKQWPHVWLSEGLATYAEIIYWEERASVYPGNAEVVLAARYWTALAATGTLVLQDTTSVNNMFDGRRVYAKGAVVLHMLRHVVGEQAFRNILSAWASEPSVRYGVAETDDLHRVAETESGLDLDVFFKQWVTDGTGHPSYRLGARWLPQGSGYRVWVTVWQTQEMPQSNVAVFEMPLDISVRTVDGEERVRVRNSQRTQVFEFTVSSRPKTITIDPDQWILHEEVDSVAASQVPAQPVILTLAPNPTKNALSLEYAVDDGGAVAVHVYDVRGRRVLSYSSSSIGAGVRFETIDTSRLASGAYFLRLESGQGAVTQKFVVLR